MWTRPFRVKSTLPLSLQAGPWFIPSYLKVMEHKTRKLNCPEAMELKGRIISSLMMPNLKDQKHLDTKKLIYSGLWSSWYVKHMF